MPQFKIEMQFSDGTCEVQDEVFDSEEDAEEYGNYLVSCDRAGAETLNLSNPGEYSLDDNEDASYEIIEVDD